MNIEGSVALVTGANRGLGAAFCRAPARTRRSEGLRRRTRPTTVDHDGVVPVQLDITSRRRRRRRGTMRRRDAAREQRWHRHRNGIARRRRARRWRAGFDTNVFGPLAMSRAFAPLLGANGGGAIVNVLSVLSWVSMPSSAMYCASKSASWSLTNSLRQELLGQGTQVLGSARRLHGHRHDRGHRRAEVDPGRRRRRRRSTAWRPGGTRCSPTTSAATSAAGTLRRPHRPVPTTRPAIGVGDCPIWYDAGWSVASNRCSTLARQRHLNRPVPGRTATMNSTNDQS